MESNTSNTSNTNTNTTVEADTTSKKKFRLASKSVFLTYKSHLSEDDVQGILGRLRDWKVDEWIACHETGESGYLHTHIAIFLRMKFQTVNPRFFDLNEIHPDVQGVRNKVKAINYVMKDGAYWGDLDDNYYKEKHIPAVVDKIINAPSLIDAFKNAENINQMINIKTVYDARNQVMEESYRKEFIGIEPRGWQRGLWSVLEGPANERTIMWFWDKVGRTGKTMFCKMWFARCPEETVLINAIARVGDTMNLITNELDKGNKVKYVFINLARQFDGKEQIYTAVENIKDGVITNNKYKCSTRMIRPPHVVVFANFAPDKSKLSIDRWYEEEVQPII